MDVVNLPLGCLRAASWNANIMGEAMLDRLRVSVIGYGLVENLVVRRISQEVEVYEVLSGNQRLKLLASAGHETVPCVVVDLDDAHARLLAQALNRIHGEDDLGIKSELIRQVLDRLPQEEVLTILPETSESLQALCSLGQMGMAEYLQNWQRAQAARLKHIQFQLTPVQLEVIQEALQRMVPIAREEVVDSPNVRGTALYLLCKAFLEMEVPP